MRDYILWVGFVCHQNMSYNLVLCILTIFISQKKGKLSCKDSEAGYDAL